MTISDKLTVAIEDAVYLVIDRSLGCFCVNCSSDLDKIAAEDLMEQLGRISDAPFETIGPWTWADHV